jgi:hypothetical protein
MNNITVKNLIEILKKYPEDTPIALRNKDDFILTEDRIYLNKNGAYFGNCAEGRKWEERIQKEKGIDLFETDEDGEFINVIPFLIFDATKW